MQLNNPNCVFTLPDLIGTSLYIEYRKTYRKTYYRKTYLNVIQYARNGYVLCSPEIPNLCSRQTYRYSHDEASLA